MDEVKRPILLVEDNLGDALLLREALRDFNSTPPFELVHVTRLDDGIERVTGKRARFEAILLDLSLPDAHGLETIVRMQRAAEITPIIVMTGLDDDAAAVEAVRAGAQDYLVKGQIDGRLLVRALSYAIERKQLQEVKRLNLERMTALKEITLALTATLNLSSVLQVLLDKVASLIPDVAMTLRLWSPEHLMLVSVASHNYDDSKWNEREAQPDRPSTLTNRVFSSKRPLLVVNVADDPRVHNPGFWRQQDLTAYLGMPLLVGEKILGVISFYALKEHEFGSQEIEFLGALASQAAVAIHNSQIHGEMQQLAASLERSNHVKDEFLGVISHELRTPLNVVKGHVEMLQSGFFGALNPDQANSLEKIAKQTSIQLAMINSILDATTMESEVATVQVDAVSLTEFLGALQHDYPSRSDGKLKFEWRYSPALPDVYTDRTKLQYILQNLINNAVKFTPEGSVTVSAEVESVRMQNPLPSNPGKSRLILRVADTGVGIAEDFLPILFEKFSQADSSTTRSHEGIGLGLYIVKRCAELLNAQITVASRLGKGTTFTVEIPCDLASQRGSIQQSHVPLDLKPSVRLVSEV